MNAKEKTMQHFNKTAANYNSTSDGKFVEPMYEPILNEIQKLQSGKILDVGCGNGNLFTLLHDGKYELYGVDFNGYIPDATDLGNDPSVCNGYEAAYDMPEIFDILNIKETDKLC